jgi:hypothetical protein
VIDMTKPCLERICFLSSTVHGAPVVRLQTHHRNFFTTRMFLAMYLVRYHPGRVFNDIGPKEMGIIRVAGLLVVEFEELALIIKTSKSFLKVPADLCKRFCAHLNEYLDIFTEWEQSYKSPVWTRMRACLVSLYFAYFARPMDNSNLRGAISEQISSLRKRALGCAGQPALDQLDAELQAGKFGLPPLDPQQLKTLESDPRFYLLCGLDQIQLVQALLLDINHRVTTESLDEDPMHAHVTLTRETGCHWNEALIDLISFKPTFEPIRAFVKEFRQRILVMMDGRQSQHVDLDQPLQSLNQCMALLGSIRECLHMVQMPIRNKATGAGWDAFGMSITSPTALIDAIKYIHHAIKTAELDNHCLRILMVSRVMNENGLMYVEQAYQQMLGDGSLTMERTKAWVSAAVGGCLQSFVTMAELTPLTTMGAVKVLYVGLDRLVFHSDDVLNNERDFPETFLLDVWRLCSLQRKIRVDVAAVCMLSNLRLLLLTEPEEARRLVLESVAQIFLELKYGVRGIDDWKFSFPCSADLLMERIKSVLPPGVFFDGLNDCLDFKSRKLQCM